MRLSLLNIFRLILATLATTATLATIATPVAAQQLTLKQQILMPGPLIADHAKFEADCESCHSPFAKQSITERCLDCHDTIAADRNRKQGFHGQSPAAISGNCETCHTDHEGRDADITGLLPDSFDHAHTRFALTGAHSHLSCDNCHQTGEPFREAASDCFSCHRDDDRHQGALGEHCQQCHQTTRWNQLLPFDHSKTDFLLTGHHSDAPCMSCHIGQQFEFKDQRCIACHRANDVHAGANGEECASCHNASGWQELDFDHNKTDFPLQGRHADIPCQACHSGEQALELKSRENTPTACNSCHRGDDIHLRRNGSECQQCHNETHWVDVQFDHGHDTDFPLSGKHSGLACNQCHSGALKDTLPRDCASCHRADDVHHDSSMALCGTCHNTNNWQATSRFDHDLSQFPLIGMHRIVPCHSCHIGNQFTLAENDCHSCHRQDDKHEGGLGTDCAQCHTPNAWTLWQFDHGKQTDFTLTGKHKGVECAACHGPGSDPSDTPQMCGGCHRQQDIHNGEFGPRCDRCHTTTNFFELNLE